MFDRLIHKWLRVPYTLHSEEYNTNQRPRATIVFIHGIGNSSRTWEAVIEKLPSDIRAVSVDLLGFGQSPRPSWATYSAHTQAKSVIATLLTIPISGKVILVGHSLGALVAIEVAKRYPLIVRSLILCSPPFYRTATDTPELLPRSDRVLRKLYQTAQRHPEQFVALAGFAIKYGIANKGFSVTADTIDTYMATLESSIVNQTAFDDAAELKKPMMILRGTLDPIVVNRNLKDLARRNRYVTITNVAASHEVRGLFVPAVLRAINSTLPVKKRQKKV